MEIHNFTLEEIGKRIVIKISSPSTKSFTMCTISAIKNPPTETPEPQSIKLHFNHFNSGEEFPTNPEKTLQMFIRTGNNFEFITNIISGLTESNDQIRKELSQKLEVFEQEYNKQ